MLVAKWHNFFTKLLHYNEHCIILFYVPRLTKGGEGSKNFFARSTRELAHSIFKIVVPPVMVSTFSFYA